MADYNDSYFSSSNGTTTFSEYYLFTGGLMDNVFDLVCRRPLEFNAIVVFLFLVSFSGLIGNLCLLFVIFSNERLRNATNILIINIAIADIVYICCNAPFYMLHELGRPCWGHGLVACQLRHYIPQVAQGVCIFSLTALSRERYSAIVKGFESRITRSSRRIYITTSLAWVFGIVTGIPVFVLTTTALGGINCVYMPLGITASEIYMMFLFVAMYIIPLGFISVHYCHIAHSLFRSTATVAARSLTGSNEQMKGRRKLAHVVLVITLFFAVFWFPHYVFYLWSFYTKNARFIEENAHFVRVFRYIDYYMALANSCLNPLIIFVMSSVHRKTLYKLRSSLVFKRQKTYSSTKTKSTVTTHRVSEQTLIKSSGSNGVNVIMTKL